MKHWQENMEQAAKEVFENIINIMPYFSRINNPAIPSLIQPNPFCQVLPSEKELSKLLDNSPNSLKKLNIHSWNPLLVTKGGIEFL